jgi:uncharacterized membrane protein
MMIKHPFLIIFVLLTIEITILWLSKQERFKKYFSFLPSIFWIYFIPIIASSVGLIDPKSPIYSSISTHLLPASLFLLLIAVDIKAILRLGKPALIMFLAGSFGIMVGAPLVFFLFKPWIGEAFWSGFGALAGSWTGGSANMIAVKEAINTPDEVFLPMVIVDTIVPYVWMGLLVAASSRAAMFDRWTKADRHYLDELSHRVEKLASQEPLSWRVDTTLLILALAVGGGFLASALAKFLPVIKDVISTYAWTIIIVSMLGIGISFTPARRLSHYGSTWIGYFILYFVLTTIGAKASLVNIQSTAVLILAGVVLTLFHAAVLVAVAKLIRAPLFLAATASQANVGGVASAPIVAEIYQPGLAAVGLLMAILGNIIGTYLGILAAQMCRWFI